MESLVIRLCTVAEMEAAPDLAALLAEYGAESSIDGLGHPEPQFDTYRQLEAVGAVRILGAFQGDQLVGFLVLITSVLPHYGVRVGTTESFFVASAARKTGAGMKLLHVAEHMAKEAGALAFMVSAPKGSKLAAVLDADKAYDETNRVFFRSLA